MKIFSSIREKIIFYWLTLGSKIWKKISAKSSKLLQTILRVDSWTISTCASYTKSLAFKLRASTTGKTMTVSRTYSMFKPHFRTNSSKPVMNKRNFATARHSAISRKSLNKVSSQSDIPVATWSLLLSQKVNFLQCYEQSTSLLIIS